MRINNKIKQFFGANWGKPKDFEHKAKIDFNELEREVPVHSKKKKRTEKKNYSSYWACPFCKEEIPIVEEEQRTRYWVFGKRAKVCNCGAKEVPDCPACKRTTWIKDFVYKHQHWGCGFEGERKHEKS